MLATALTAALGAFQMPSDVALPAALEGRAVETVLQASATHFVAWNTSFEAQVAVFGSPERSLLASVVLRPGQRVVFPFPAGASDDVWVEILGIAETPFRTTGALSVRELADAAHGTLWIETAGPYAVGWWENDGELEHARAHPEYAVPSLRGLRAGAYESGTAPTHVPVIAPDDDRERTRRPPKIDERPLPPV